MIIVFFYALNRPGFFAHVLYWEGWRDVDQVRREHQGQGGAAGLEHSDSYDSEWAAIEAISGRLGMNPETLCKWVRQAEVDAGEADGVTSQTMQELRELRRKNRELEATIVILCGTDCLAA
jgi:transposase